MFCADGFTRGHRAQVVFGHLFTPDTELGWSLVTPQGREAPPPQSCGDIQCLRTPVALVTHFGRWPSSHTHGPSPDPVRGSNNVPENHVGSQGKTVHGLHDNRSWRCAWAGVKRSWGPWPGSLPLLHPTTFVSQVIKVAPGEANVTEMPTIRFVSSLCQFALKAVSTSLSG